MTTRKRHNHKWTSSRRAMTSDEIAQARRWLPSSTATTLVTVSCSTCGASNTEQAR